MFDVKYLKRSVAGIVTILAFATTAGAATLSVVGGTPYTLTSKFSASFMGGPAPLPTVGTKVTNFTGADPFSGGTTGLAINGNSRIKFTYIGKEAAATNLQSQFGIGGQSLSTNDVLGASFEASQTGPGFVNFVFTTLERKYEDLNKNGTAGEYLSIFNGIGSGYSALGMAFGTVFNNGRSVLAFFDDGRADVDYDDIVIRIDAIPLPASALLLLGALGGLGALRLRRKSALA